MHTELDRKEVLLKATYDILVKCYKSPYVLNVLATTAHYDSTECDGSSLIDDIAYELDLPDIDEL